MKTIYQLALSALISGTVVAQTTVVNPASLTNKAKPAKVAQFDKSKFNAKFSNPSLNVGSYWVNYASVVDQALGGGPGQTGPAALSSNYLNTDSLLYGNFGGTYSGIWVHHLGDILDIRSNYFSQILGTNWDNTTTYNVDSVSIVYAYTRKVNSIDTLIFTFYQNNPATNITNSGFIGTTASNYGTDTVSVKILKYTYTNNTPNASGVLTFKVPLDQTDTAEVLYGEKFIALPSAYSVGANKLMACAVTFKPGYNYVLGDSADSKNAFYFTSYEENGDGGGTGTFPSYTDCNYQSAACDYNSSHIVPIDVRYNNAGTWNGRFIPSYAYTVGYGFEHHLISYHVNEGAVGIKEVSNNDVNLEQNIPNPFNGTTVINYSLKNNAKSVKFDVVDFSGRLVYSSVENDVKSGNHNISLDASKFAKGVYFYSINADGLKMSKKMIVE